MPRAAVPDAATNQGGPPATRRSVLEALLFTALAVVLYLVSDRLLDALERRAGRRFEYRSMIFFGILLLLALVAFAVVRRLGTGA